ncbi:hypothetical protein GDO81_012434 [Engystomops pustulosus]|uniref:Uncharacterized protein n=1 Tax=Engystomops pustulosus TaxID=76066 RepID=A0AAV7BLV1_ENGPU|nr:hypothetical protein GDO81_012434 [Engystomops pustulosus]
MNSIAKQGPLTMYETIRQKVKMYQKLKANHQVRFGDQPKIWSERCNLQEQKAIQLYAMVLVQHRSKKEDGLERSHWEHIY